MFKLYKNFKAKDWIAVILIIGLTVLQVYLTMTIVDYVQAIMKAITYVNYHNNPGDLGPQVEMMIMAVGNGDIESGWSYIAANKDILAANGMDNATIEMVLGIATASTADIWKNGGMMIAYAAGIMLVQATISLIASYVAANLSTSIRTKIYNKVEGYSLAEINMFSTASLITRTTNDIQQVQMANLLTMRMIFAAPITAIWAIIKIKASSTELTIATGIAIILLIIFIATLMIAVLPKFRSMQKLTDKLNAVTRENLTGIRIVRAFNAENYQEERFDAANKAVTDAQIFTGRAMSLMSPIMMVIMNGITLAIYWIGARLINKGTIDYPTVTSFMMLSSQIIMAFVMLMMMFVMWPRAIVAAKRINEVLDTDTSIVNPKEALEPVEQGTIEFKNVSFKYPDGDSPAVSDLSFKVKKGETLAFIGATGVGKSTIINLIPRLYDATSGEVLVDGINVKDFDKKKLRSLIGYVPQKGFLFKGTIKENIALGRPSMTLEEIESAATIACAKEFIESKDDKYDSLIAQGGKNVSGGQKQRLCIARAVAMNPEIYIFDDSFSALDYKTDLAVRNNLAQYAADATKVIVAQRIGTIMDADQIIVLDNGRIVGIGTHKELLETSDVYREIALSQLSKEELGLCQE